MVPDSTPGSSNQSLGRCGVSPTGRYGYLCTTQDRFSLVQQSPAVLLQRAILPGKLVCRVPHQFPAALVKFLALPYYFLTCVDQVIRGFFSLAD